MNKKEILEEIEETNKMLESLPGVKEVIEEAKAERMKRKNTNKRW